MKYLFFGLLIILTGCAGMAANNHISNAANKESSAWNTVHVEAAKSCPKGSETKPLPKAQSMKAYDCHMALIEKYVRPVAFNPNALNRYQLEMKKISVAYKKGIIDRDEAGIRMQEGWINYNAGLNQQAQMVMIDAQQRDQRVAQGMQHMSDQMHEQEMQRMYANQQMMLNRPKTTTCNNIANTVRCTTW